MTGVTTAGQWEGGGQGNELVGFASPRTKESINLEKTNFFRSEINRTCLGIFNMRKRKMSILRGMRWFKLNFSRFLQYLFFMLFQNFFVSFPFAFHRRDRNRIRQYQLTFFPRRDNNHRKLSKSKSTRAFSVQVRGNFSSLSTRHLESVVHRAVYF